MARRQEFYGKLPPEALADLDRLLLKLRETNSALAGRRVIRREEIVPLPDDEYVRLWDYLRHCCHLAASWPNKMAAIRAIAGKRNMSFREVQEEAVDSMTIHCYTYAWRHYRHPDDGDSSAYVLSTAKFGWLSWIEEQNNFHCGIDSALRDFMEEADKCGHKVTTRNFG